MLKKMLVSLVLIIVAVGGLAWYKRIALHMGAKWSKLPAGKRSS